MTEGYPRKLPRSRKFSGPVGWWAAKGKFTRTEQRVLASLMGLLVGGLFWLSAAYLYFSYKASPYHVDAEGRRIPPDWAGL